MNLDDQPRIELEATVFRHLVAHLRARADMQDAARERAAAPTKDEVREHVYGKPYERWKALCLPDATPEQLELSQRERPRSAKPGNSWTK